MSDRDDQTPFSLLTLLGLKPFGIKAAVSIYLLLSVGWLAGLGFAKSSDLLAMRAKTQDEITAERWQKTNDPSQLGKSQPSPAPNQPSGLNELFRPQPNGINPFDATRQTQASTPQLVADWPTRIETMALMGSLPLLALIGVLLFARHIRNLERSEAEAIAAEKARAEEERHRARRRGKGIPMRRLR